MKRVLLLAGLFFCLQSSQLKAADASEQYIDIFNIVMTADGLKSDGQGRQALQKYMLAERELKALQSAYSTWNPKIVRFRLQYLDERIKPLKVQYPGTEIIEDAPRAGGAKGKGKNKRKKSPVDTVLRDLNEKLIESSQEKSKLRDQLREALSARPAESDPAAYAAAQAKIRQLEQAKDVSTVTIDQRNNELSQLRRDYDSVQVRLQKLESRDRLPAMKSENERLQGQINYLNQQMKSAPNVDEIQRRMTLLETDLQSAEAKNRTLEAQNAALQQQSRANNTDQLQAENSRLKVQVAELNRLSQEVGKIESINRQLASVQTSLQSEKSLTSELKRQNLALEEQMRKDDASGLKQSNLALRNEIRQLEQITAKIPDVEKLEKDLVSARAKIQAEQAMRAALAKDKEKLEQLLTDPNTQIGTGMTAEMKALETEKKNLEAQIRRLADEQKAAADRSSQLARQRAAEAARLKQLERERGELQRALDKALKDAERFKKEADKSAAVAAKQPRNRQVAKVTPPAPAPAPVVQPVPAPVPPKVANVAAPKPAPVPTPVPVPAPAPIAKPEPAPQPKQEFPASAKALALQAQQDYQNRQYAAAEAKYMEVLKAEQNNVFTLANLAATQMELNKLELAKANLNKAIGLAPNDAFSMSLLGLVKFRESDFEGAHKTLEAASRLDPSNAQTQNYLGLALSQQGERIAAETAFRRAVKLAPGYSVAHYNLAVFYATAEPASPELANWHYQKALSGGYPKNQELEKILAKR
ncbi:MAG: hypothetical protein ACPGVU_17745 [Limisphaerales bacterium]